MKCPNCGSENTVTKDMPSQGWGDLRFGPTKKVVGCYDCETTWPLQKGRDDG